MSNAIQDALIAALNANPKLAAMLAASITQPKPASRFAKRNGRKPQRQAKPVARQVEATTDLVDARTDRSLKNEILARKAFQRAGYKDAEIVPHKTIMTYKRWIANGRKVRAGESSVKAGTLRLFHITQTDVYTPEPVDQAVVDAAVAAKAAAVVVPEAPAVVPQAVAPTVVTSADPGPMPAELLRKDANGTLRLVEVPF